MNSKINNMIFENSSLKNKNKENKKIKNIIKNNENDESNITLDTYDKICTVCTDANLNDLALLQHYIDKHGVDYNSFDYDDVQLQPCTKFNPQFISSNPCFYQSMAALTKEHPESILEEITLLFPSEADTLRHQGFPFDKLHLYSVSKNYDMNVLLQSDKEIFSFCNGKHIRIGTQSGKRIYLRYNIGVHYNLCTKKKIIKGAKAAPKDFDLLKIPTLEIQKLKEEVIKLDGFDHNMVQPIIKLLNDFFLSNTSIENLYRDHVRTNIIAIANCIVGVSTSALTLILNKVTTVTKAMQIVNITTNISTIAYSIYSLCKYWNIPYDIEKVVASIAPILMDTVETLTNLENVKANNASLYMTPIIATIVAVVTAGLVAYTPTKIKDVIVGGNLIKSLREFTNVGKDSITYFLKDLCSLDIYGDVGTYNAVIETSQRGSELSVIPVYRYIQDTTLLFELKSFIPKAIQLNAKPLESKELTSALISAKQALNGVITALNEKLKAINAITDSKTRVETVAVLLAGDAGVGKSRLVRYLASQIAKKFGVPSDMYNCYMEVGGSFAQPYGGELFGVNNEFMAMRSEKDTFLNRFNGIVSGDAYNFESAHLEGKVQPCFLRIVFLTSNVLTPDFKRQIHENAAEAIWSRIIRYEIVDERLQGRFGDNSHRQPDYSHLTINRIEGNLNSIKRTPITINNMLAQLIHIYATREINFFNSRSQEDKIPVDPEIMNNLISIRDATIRANAGKDFFVVRYQGEPGTAKSTKALALAERLKNHLPRHKFFQIQHLLDFERFDSTTLGIYLIDDIVISDNDMDIYFRWINQGNPSNIYIFVTNTVYKRKFYSVLGTAYNIIAGKKPCKYWSLPGNLHEGIARRIGLNGLVHVEQHSSYINIPEISSTLIDTFQGMRIEVNGIPMLEKASQELIFSRYHKFNELNSRITIVEEPYEGNFNFTVDINTPNFSTLIETLSSGPKIWAAYKGRNNNFKLEVDNDFSKQMFGKTFVKDWIVPEKLSSNDDMIDLMMRMAVSLRRADPNSSCRIVFSELGSIFVYNNSKIHVINNLIEECELELNEEKIITCCTKGENIKIDPQEYAMYRQMGQLSGQVSDIPMIVLEAINNYYTCLSPQDKIRYDTMMVKYQGQKLESNITTTILWETLKNNKAIAFVGGIFCVISLYTVGKALYTLFSPSPCKDQEEPRQLIEIKGKIHNKGTSYEWEDQPTYIYANSSDDENGEFHEHKQRYIKAILEGDHKSVRRIQDEAESSGHGQRFRQWEYDLRSNSKLRRVKQQQVNSENIYQDIINNGDEESLVSVVNADPKGFKKFLMAKSNALSLKESGKEETQIEKFANSLYKSYVLITATETAYGLSLGRGKFLTVSHIVDTVGQIGKISSNGTYYEARCILLNRARDISIWKSDKIPPQRDMSKFLLPFEAIDDISVGYFFRPGTTKNLIYGSNLNLTKKWGTPKTDPINPRFQLSELFWEFSTITLSNTLNVFRDGDCGLPLITILNNQPYIIGIHNSYSRIGMAYFSAISSDENEVMCKANSKLVYPIIPNVKTEEPFVIHPRLKDRLMCDMEFSKFDNSKLTVLGYNPQLYIHSKPKHSKFMHKIPGMKLDCQVSPSALLYEGYMDDTNLFKDKFGKPHTLFTQCDKYSKRTDTYRTWDKAILNDVIILIKEKFVRDYGPLKTINLKQIINGMDFLKPLEMTTSPGPLMKLSYNLVDKTKLFENKGDVNKPYYVISSNQYGIDLKEQFYAYDAAIQNGIPIFVLSKDNAKVELLPTEKVKLGKVRLFNELDLAFNMILKKYFGDLLDKIIEVHEQTDYAIGANFYTLPSHIMRYFNSIDGEYISADVSSLDKSIPKEIIEIFVDITCSQYSPSIKKALTNSLIYTTHTMDGHLYVVGNGNESGSFVTTLLNCVCMDVIFTYTVVDWFYKNFNKRPTLVQLDKVFKKRILGDDIVIKTSLPLDLNTFKIHALTFNINVTVAKLISKFPSFCSREFFVEPKDINVCYPRLKKSSIIAPLFYYKNSTPSQVGANINVALFEASLWDESFFNEVLHDCLILIRYYKLKEVECYTYLEYRKAFSSYVKAYKTSPIILSIGKQDDSIKIHRELISNSISLFKNTMEDQGVDYISKVNLFTQKHGFSPMVVEEISSGPSNMPLWQVRVSACGIIKEAEAYGRKVVAKNLACKLVWDQLATIEPLKANSSSDDNLQSLAEISNSPKYQDYEEVHYITTITRYNPITELYTTRLKESDNPRLFTGNTLRTSLNNFRDTQFKVELNFEIVYRMIETQYNMAQDILRIKNWPKIYLYKSQFITELIKKENVEGINVKLYKYGGLSIPIVESQSMKHVPYNIALDYYSLFNIRNDTEGIYIISKNETNPFIVKANSMKNPMIEPSSIQQTVVDTQQIPEGMNPQVTGQAPAMAPMGENAISAVEGISKQVLNPIGAPNMMGVGAIEFDIKELIYQQFLDSDVEIQFTDDAPSGTILFQIPYDPLGVHINPYIKQYVQLHERYTGSLMFRITVVGNPLFSGYLGICWQPRKIMTPTMPISEFQKYAYDSKGVTMPWSEIHQLHDARKEYFYRETTEVVTNDRPHLVVALIVSVVNPLREGVITRLRIASKLAQRHDGNPFMVTLPTLALVSPLSRAGNLLNSTSIPLFELFPQAINNEYFFYTDGTSDATNIGVGPKMEIYNDINSGLASSYTVNPATTFNVSDTQFRPIGDFAPITSQLPTGKYLLPSIRISTNLPKNELLKFANYIDIFNVPNAFYTRLRSADAYNDNKYRLVNIIATDILLEYPVVGIALRPCYTGGTVKVITQYGYIEYTLFITAHTDSNLSAALNNNTIPTTEGIPARILRSNIDALLVKTGPYRVNLPAGWQSLKFTEIPPSSITIVDPNMPTATCNPTFLDALSIRSTNLQAGQILQFSLVDNLSARNIATIWYIPATNQMVINTLISTPSYRVLDIPLSRVTINGFTAINTTNDFPTTRMEGWIDRLAPGFSLNKLYKNQTKIGNPFIKPDIVKANGQMLGMAALQGAAGGMQGIGAGIGQYAQNKWGEKMQGNQLTHEKDLQEKLFGQQNLQQGAQFAHEGSMQGNMFNFQDKYQQQQFQHNFDINEMNQAFQQVMQNQGFDLQNRNTIMAQNNQMHNNLLARGLSTPSARLRGATVASSQA